MAPDSNRGREGPTNNVFRDDQARRAHTESNVVKVRGRMANNMDLHPGGVSGIASSTPLVGH